METNKPHYWPENPYPESIFPMLHEEYSEVVPDPKTRTALSGMLGREFWDIASNTIWDAVQLHMDEFKYDMEVELTALKNTVQLCCNPPDDCNDPKVLKRFMQQCLKQALGGEHK